MHLRTIINEFKTFISRGNVLDLSVAVIMGQAFTGIVNSMVNDLLTPLLGMVLGGIEFNDLTITIGAAEVRYGSFIQASINFLIIALVVFFLVTSINKLQKVLLGIERQQPKTEITLLTEIRDLLKTSSTLDS